MRLQVGALHVERHRLHKALAQRLSNIVGCGDQCAVLAECLDHAHALKLGQPVLVVGNLKTQSRI